jgi:hypothetical protein
LRAALTHYVDALGWPVTINLDEVVLTCGLAVDVVTIPMGLAGEVNHLLGLHSLSAPVMEVRGLPNTWAFFTASKSIDSGEIFRPVLSLHRIHHFGMGDAVRLPEGPDGSGSERRWVVPPDGGPTRLPRLGALVSCVLIAIKR